ncbi:MAG TPA: large conductance mechanosensitive channel protein MscL [Gemmatimonadaceae bacterium]|jgi:large conductance mechanosensitive channel|nr:large conductance mechanosensitive channel protein MscL [Gemmatimonadaceae bacterium]
MWKDFKAFLMRGNVIDLAVAVVIGAAFGTIVKSAVDDVIMPPISLLTGRIDFSSRYILLRDGIKAPPPYATPAEAKAAGAVTLNYGVFVNNVIAFLVIAAVIFLMVKAINRMYNKPAPKTDNSRPCPYCTLSVANAARRCPHCTSELAVV